MKNLISICTFSALLTTHIAFANDTQKQVAQAFSQTYAQETLKIELAKYVNRHPDLVFSTSPSIGTDSLFFLSKSIAAVGFLAAQSDNGRLWAGAHLVIAPDPATTTVLICAQIADMYINLQNQRAITEIRERIMKLRAETIAIYSRLFEVETNDFNEQINRLVSAVESVQKMTERIQSRPMYRYFVTDHPSEPTPSTDEISEALNDISDLNIALLELDVASALFEGLAERLKSLDKGSEQFRFIQDLRKTARSFEPLHQQVDRIGQAYGYFFGSLRSAEFNQKTRESSREYASTLRIYTHCVDRLNFIRTAQFFKMNFDEIEAARFVEDCQSRSNIKGEI